MQVATIFVAIHARCGSNSELLNLRHQRDLRQKKIDLN